MRPGRSWDAWWPARWQLRYQRWIGRRIPPTREIALGQRNLFIFLSWPGLGWLILTALVWVGATNYQNNLVMALCFLLLAILFVAIHLTFANMNGLRVRFASVDPVFAGEQAACRFVLQSTSRHQQVSLDWPGDVRTVVSIQADVPCHARVACNTFKRGVYKPGRIRLQTDAPFGVVRCWTWLDLCVDVLVYPAPIEADYRDYAQGDGDESGRMVSGAEDYFALRNYVPGDTPSRVAWKQYAAGRGLFVREYVDYRGADIWLDYFTMPDVNPEQRLSKLCYCVLTLAEMSLPFGVRLPQTRFEPATGDEHIRHVLRALAECPV